jgi:hypothetical protein
MKRSWSFPTVNQLTDLVLFICSIITLEFIFGSMLENLVDQRMTEEDFVFRVVFNIFDHIWFKFEYVFAIMIVCLIMRLLILLEFNQSIGPLIKIVGKMAKDFWNFFLLYAMITIMFSIVGNLNLLIYLNNFKDFFSSILTVIDTAVGNYSFDAFQVIPDSDLQLLAILFTMCIVVAFNILMMNLIIAILANTYNIFDSRSNGLYLSKILVSRDEMIYDPCYGCFLSSLPPINLV